MPVGVLSFECTLIFSNTSLIQALIISLVIGGAVVVSAYVREFNGRLASLADLVSGEQLAAEEREDAAGLKDSSARDSSAQSD
ncbi:hypothetical protein KDL01_12910 [Actinospica durhamensis]|uniref:Uncharacterized protein n=1 Tax=Actinospica durhamensis TaxID=1508375 RepID=A0A941EPJ0_9ACTN|nr:hypothetical protein [Actinospica durhamensis]MBR7834168.1 hypothetical protein [Actinospica durhamensis]